MGSLKTLAYVGAVAMVAASATTAFSADLAPAPMLAPPPPPPMDSGMSGLYLRGDVGVGHMGESTVSSVLNTPGFVVGGARFDQKNFDSVAFAGAGIGYQFNNFMRVDITGEYRTGSRFTGLQTYDDLFGSGCFNARCADRYTGTIRSSVFLANGYFDLGTWRGLTPFVGAGIGFANHKVQSLTDMGMWPTPGYGIASDKSSTKLAWALMAGLGFEVTRNLKMEIGYRYLNMGTVNSGQIACNSASCPYESHKYKLQSHDVKVGFRYLLADDAPAAAPMMMPVPAAAPVMRRY